MYLRELIAALECEDPDKVLPIGFAHPHSYRGYYGDLAFERENNITVGRILIDANRSLGQTFQGYKGGDFTMHEYTKCWLANYGQTGETIGPLLLQLLLAQ